MSRLLQICVVAVLWTLACGFPKPADVGAGGGSDGSGGGIDPGGMDCQLTAIEPAIANSGDTITLEGTFMDNAAVNFPGGISVAANLLGTHRATVEVPSSVSEGELTLSACGKTLGPVWFRRASFSLGLGAFASNVEQTSGARQAPLLVTARDSHTSVVIGRYLYIIGGAGSGGSLRTVERALINADGTLGAFETMPGGNLTTPRRAHTTVVVGNHLYVIGGFGDRLLSSVEQAMIDPDGNLGSFSLIPGVELTAARLGHANVVIGNYLYVLGGLGGNTLNSIERASIHADGTLGSFAVVSGVMLATARHGHTAAVTGTYLYLLGGEGSNGLLRNVERSTINADGSLGAFETVSEAFLTTPRAGHTTERIGRHLYAFFGNPGGNTTLNTVEQAPLNSDGSLGPFEPVPGPKTLASHGHVSAVVGNYLYFLGGSNDFGFTRESVQASLNVGSMLEAFTTESASMLIISRAGHNAAVVGDQLYVFGGRSLDTCVERALINPDGSLGPFSKVSGLNLAIPRSGAVLAIIANHLYVIGGSELASVERANISADGTLSTFEMVDGVTLTTARKDPTATIIGDNIYIFGGSGPGGVLDDVEQASIRPDGSLSTFSRLDFNKLTTQRAQHATALVGGNLYLLGGNSTTVIDLDSVERADVHNGLTPFEIVPGTTITANRGLNAAVIGNALYALGGTFGVIDRATINPDGSLGPFVANSGNPLERFFPATVVLKNHVHVLGGVFGRAPVNTIDTAQLR